MDKYQTYVLSAFHKAVAQVLRDQRRCSANREPIPSGKGSAFCLRKERDLVAMRALELPITGRMAWYSAKLRRHLAHPRCDLFLAGRRSLAPLEARIEGITKDH